ncbi:MAG: hypothetical protein WC926_01290 [Candidatus Paceibacterota bacterium]|jgi:hypothetical protein
MSNIFLTIILYLIFIGLPSLYISSKILSAKNKSYRELFFRGLQLIAGGIILFILASMMIVDFNGRTETEINLFEGIVLFCSFLSFVAGVMVSIASFIRLSSNKKP